MSKDLFRTLKALTDEANKSSVQDAATSKLSKMGLINSQQGIHDPQVNPQPEVSPAGVLKRIIGNSPASNKFESHQNFSRELPVSPTVGNSELDAFLNAISTQESNGNYQAKGVATKYGTAYGKYQILDSNFVNPGGWDKEAIGKDISLQEYLSNPQIQERIAQWKLSDYFRKYGATGAAKAWYAGPGNANTNSDSPQYGGPSINDYAASVLKHMQGNI